MRLLVVLLTGCNSSSDEPTGTWFVYDVCDDAPTWDNHAAGFVSTWCQPCHTAQLDTPEARQNATPGVNFDTWSDVYDFRNPIRDRVVPDAPATVDLAPVRMPPAGGISLEDIDLFVEWIDCGAEGEDDPPSECATPTTAGDVVVASQAEADALCAAGAVALGSLEIRGAVELGCACSVTANLVLGPGSADVSLPLLSSIGGSLRAESGGTLKSLTAPELQSVTGDLVFTNEAALSSFQADALATVGGDLTATGLGALTELDIPGMLTVGGDFVVADAPLLTTIDVARLRTVGASMQITDLPALTSLDGTRALEKVGFVEGGGLVLSGLDALPAIDEFAFLLLEEVHGDIVVSDNAQLFGVDGFTVFGIDTYMFLPGPGLEPVAIPHEHTIRITGNPNLDHIDGFGNLRVSNGTLEISDSPVRDISGFVNLQELGGDLLLDDLPGLDELTGFGALLSVAGSVTMDGIALPAVTAFGAVTNVGGDIVLEGGGVQAFAGFLGLTSLGGDLRFTSNVLLVDLASFPLLSSVGGSFELVDNPKLDAFEMAGITAVEEHVLIQDNEALVALPGLALLTTVGGDLAVIDNLSLPTADIVAWADGITVGGTVVIEGNQ